MSVSFFVVFLSVSSICGPHVSLLSNVISRYLGCLQVGLSCQESRYSSVLVDIEKSVVTPAFVDLDFPCFGPFVHPIYCFLHSQFHHLHVHIASVPLCRALWMYGAKYFNRLLMKIMNSMK